MTILAYPSRGLPAAAFVAESTDVELLDDATLETRLDGAGDERPCRKTNPENYFPLVGKRPPQVGGPRYIREQERANALCAGCPVKAECGELALRLKRGLFGVWGGTSEWERAGIRAARIQAARTQVAGAAV